MRTPLKWYAWLRSASRLWQPAIPVWRLQCTWEQCDPGDLVIDTECWHGDN